MKINMLPQYVTTICYHNVTTICYHNMLPQYVTIDTIPNYTCTIGVTGAPGTSGLFRIVAHQM